MNIDSFVSLYIKENIRTNLYTIINALQTHNNMYSKAENDNDKRMAAIVLNKILNDIICYDKEQLDVLEYKELEVLYSETKNAIDNVITYYTINMTKLRNIIFSKTPKQAKEEEIDYSKLTKAELIELLINKK